MEKPSNIESITTFFFSKFNIIPSWNSAWAVLNFVTWVSKWRNRILFILLICKGNLLANSPRCVESPMPTELQSHTFLSRFKITFNIISKNMLHSRRRLLQVCHPTDIFKCDSMHMREYFKLGATSAHLLHRKANATVLPPGFGDGIAPS